MLIIYNIEFLLFRASISLGGLHAVVSTFYIILNMYWRMFRFSLIVGEVCKPILRRKRVALLRRPLRSLLHQPRKMLGVCLQ